MPSAPHTRAQRYGWLTEDGSPVMVAGCVTVVVGQDVAAVANAFGADLDDRVPVASDRRWGTEQLAAVAAVAAGEAPVVMVVEDNGFEGSRQVVLTQASRRGKAASVFWNVNGLVMFSCATRGKVAFSGELGPGEDYDGLPRRLTPYLRLLEDEDLETPGRVEVDPVAVGAAMVETFTGIAITPGHADAQTWHPVTPQIEEPPVETAQTSGLRHDHDDLLTALVEMPATSRRPLAQYVAGLAVEQGSLIDEPAVVEVLTSITASTPGTYTARMETLQRRWNRDADDLWHAQDAAENAGGEPPLPAEEGSVGRRLWVPQALQYACHHDDLSAVLGVVRCTLIVYSVDGHEAILAEHIVKLASLAPHVWPQLGEELPVAPSLADRERQLAEQQDQRDREAQAAMAAEEAWEWGGITPSPRMRAAGFAVQSLAYRDPVSVLVLAKLTDTRLRELAIWTVRRVLEDANLIDRPWLANDIAAIGNQQPTGSDQQTDRLTELFAALAADHTVTWTTYTDDDGDRVSIQHMALGVVFATQEPTPLAAACTAIDHAWAAYGPRTPDLLKEIWARFAPNND